MEAHSAVAGFLSLLVFLLQLADGQMTIGEGKLEEKVSSGQNNSEDHVQLIPAVGRYQLPSSTDRAFVAATTLGGHSQIPLTELTTVAVGNKRVSPSLTTDTDKGGGTDNVLLPVLLPDRNTRNTTRSNRTKQLVFNGTMSVSDNQRQNTTVTYAQQYLCINGTCISCLDNNSTNCSRLNNTLEASRYTDFDVNTSVHDISFPIYNKEYDESLQNGLLQDSQGGLQFQNKENNYSDSQSDLNYYYDDDYDEEPRDNSSKVEYDIGDEDYYQQPSEDQWIRDSGQGGSIEGSELFYGPHGFEAQLGPLEELKLARHEPVELHPASLDGTAHDASLSILVFYTWIGVVIIMVIGAFIALKHRHRVTAIANYVWVPRSGYRKETVFATEEGRNLLTHQQV